MIRGFQLVLTMAFAGQLSAEQPQLHAITSVTGSTVEAMVIGLSDDQSSVFLLVKKELPLKMLSEQSQNTIALLTHSDRETREFANSPDFIRVPKSIDMSITDYLKLPVSDRIPMVGTLLYLSITNRIATEEFLKKVQEPQQLNAAAVIHESLSTPVIRKMPAETKFASALGAYLQHERVIEPQQTEEPKSR